EFIRENEIDDETVNTYRSELIQFNTRSAAGEQLELAYEKAINYKIIELREQPPKPIQRPKKLKFDELNEVLRGLTFSSLKVDQYNERLIESLQRLTLSFGEGKHDKGIWVHGQFGRGKTYVLGALANELHARGAEVTFM